MTVRPGGDIDGVLRSHARLLATVTRIDDEVARQPTRLAGWDVAMLVTHLARNADSHTRAADGARLGEGRSRYPAAGARDAGIDAGRGRSADHLIEDLATSIVRLETAWESLPAEAWAVVAPTLDGEPEPMVDLPRFRWRETEIHHVDLGLGFTIGDWDDAFVATELDVWLACLSSRLADGTGATITAVDAGRTWQIGPRDVTIAVMAPSPSLLAWLVDRPVTVLPEIGPWQW